MVEINTFSYVWVFHQVETVESVMITMVAKYTQIFCLKKSAQKSEVSRENIQLNSQFNSRLKPAIQLSSPG
jgi:hypothetical protein